MYALYRANRNWNQRTYYKDCYIDFVENGYCEYDIYDTNSKIFEFTIYDECEFETLLLNVSKCFKLLHSFSLTNGAIWSPIEVSVDNNNIVFTDENNNEYVGFEINYPDIFHIPNTTGCNTARGYIDKKYTDEIISIYKIRNEKILQEQNEICNYINENILFMANNILALIDKDDMLDYRLISCLYFIYSHTGYKSDFANYQHLVMYPLFKYVDDKKGKEKKEIENFNSELYNKIHNANDVINNLTEIIIEEETVKPYIARAIAWESIQRSVINFYGNKWAEEFEPHLESTYDEMSKCNCSDIDINNVFSSNCAKEYIKNVLECEKIDIETSKEILMYFFLYKNGLTEELDIYGCFVMFYNSLNEIKKKLQSNDIKNKIKSKQVIKPIKYTIDDIDLMTGFEFESFIELLFSKMGYSAYATKKSGDQGIDVIAIKDNTKIGIQAKCYSFTVGNSAIQEVVAGKAFYNCTKLIVIINNFFTNSAKELARSNNVILWDRNMLKQKIKELL